MEHVYFAKEYVVPSFPVEFRARETGIIEPTVPISGFMGIARKFCPFYP
jgi:hypothetical protein